MVNRLYVDTLYTCYIHIHAKYTPYTPLTSINIPYATPFTPCYTPIASYSFHLNPFYTPFPLYSESTRVTVARLDPSRVNIDLIEDLLKCLFVDGVVRAPPFIPDSTKGLVGERVGERGGEQKEGEERVVGDDWEEEEGEGEEEGEEEGGSAPCMKGGIPPWCIEADGEGGGQGGGGGGGDTVDGSVLIFMPGLGPITQVNRLYYTLQHPCL